MDKLPDEKNWDESTLRIEILRRLYIVNRNMEHLADGLSPGYLMKELNAELSLFEDTIEWLLDNEYVYVGTRAFLISSDGIKYLAENDEPPANDFSRIPRRPAPSAGDVSAKLKASEADTQNTDNS